jgi:hypothetical protein
MEPMTPYEIQQRKKFALQFFKNSPLVARACLRRLVELKKNESKSKTYCAKIFGKKHA